jgi:phosphate transport system substrate-binding protein
MKMITLFGSLGVVAVTVASLMAQSNSAERAIGSVAKLSNPTVSTVQEPPKVDADIPKYQKSSGIAGNLSSVGSDTLNNLMTFWTEGFKHEYPNIKIQVEGKGSNTAPPALTEGTAQLGPMSRTMKDAEMDQFEKKHGYKPTAVKVAVDALAVWVHKDNPIDKLTLPQVDAIFSKSRKGGFKDDITTWGQLGLRDAFARMPISLYGRDSASGTYNYFKEHALYKGDYKDTVKEQKGSATVVNGVTEDLGGIGYSGIGYRTAGVKPLAIAAKEGAEYYTTDSANVYSGKYPLSRFLYVYVNKEPNKPLDPLVREFLKYILSQEGQTIVVKDGYIPLTGKMIAQELGKLESAN